jgi:outer membrane protein, heavy metal efflux system
MHGGQVMKLRNLVFSALFFWLMPVWGLAQTRPESAESKTITLGDVLTRVLERNPEIAVSQLEIDALAQRILQAGVRPNPEIVTEIQNLPAIAGDGLFYSTEASIEWSQKLELGGKREARVALAEKTQGIAGGRLRLKKNELVAAASLAFAEVLADQERLKNQRELTRLARQAHGTVVDRVAAGKVSPVEQTRAIVALAAAQLEEDKLLTQLDLAKDKLGFLWAGDGREFSEVDGRFELSPAPAGFSAPCLEANPELSLAAAEIESQRAALSLEQTSRKPDITLSAGYRRMNFENINAWVMGISIPIPLFDKREGAIAEARLRVDQAGAEKKATEWRLRSRLLESRREYEIALQETVALTGSAIPAAKQALESIEEGYRLGKFDFLNLLDAQRTHAEIQRRYIEAVAAGLKSRVEMERLARCDAHEIPHGSGNQGGSR